MQIRKNFSIVESLRFGFLTLIEHFAFFIALIATQWGILLLVCGLLAVPSYVFFAKKINATMTMLDVANSSISELVTIFLHQIDLYAMIGFLTVFSLIFCLLISFFALGNTKIGFEFYDKQESHIKTLFSCGHLIVCYIIATMLYLLMIAIGLLCFVIPGIYLMITYGFYRHGIVYKNLGIMESFKQSAEITQGSKLGIFGLMFLFLLMQSVALSFLD